MEGRPISAIGGGGGGGGGGRRGDRVLRIHLVAVMYLYVLACEVRATAAHSGLCFLCLCDVIGTLISSSPC